MQPMMQSQHLGCHTYSWHTVWQTNANFAATDSTGGELQTPYFAPDSSLHQQYPQLHAHTSSCFGSLLLLSRCQAVLGQQLSSLVPQVLLQRMIPCRSSCLPCLQALPQQLCFRFYIGLVLLLFFALISTLRLRPLKPKRVLGLQ